MKGPNMDDYDEFDIESFKFPMTLNYEGISKDKRFLPFVRILALDLLENPYMTIGSFFNALSEPDLYEILKIIDTDEEKALENILIVTEMLAQAEGLVSEDLSELTSRTNTMLTYFVIESLRRKGLVKVYYENMSFGEDYEKKIIVERLDGWFISFLCL